MLGIIYSVSIRGLGMVFRFGLVAYLAKKLDIPKFRSFGLLVDALHVKGHERFPEKAG